MRATTLVTPNISRAILAAMMLELSPLETAANAAASRMPASIRVPRSKPTPVTIRPLKSAGSRVKASGSWSMMETLWPYRSTLRASAEPTRPQPRITTCTPQSVVPRSRPGRCVDDVQQRRYRTSHSDAMLVTPVGSIAA